MASAFIGVVLRRFCPCPYRDECIGMYVYLERHTEYVRMFVMSDLTNHWEKAGGKVTGDFSTCVIVPRTLAKDRVQT